MEARGFPFSQNWEKGLGDEGQKRRELSFPLLLFLLCAACLPVFAQSPPPPMTLGAAAAATELPLGPWGPYSRSHYGPCYLANRLLSQLFAFPLVIGQRQDELAQTLITGADGKTRPHTERVTLERRAMGLAPVQAKDDDRALPDAPEKFNRLARLQAANADGLFWSLRVPFAPAAFAQSLAPRLDSRGNVTAAAQWTEGEATVAYFPAFADPDVDGLLIRVSLTNRSTAPQTYYVDLLGGMNNVGEGFPLKDFTVLAEPGSDGVTVQHKRAEFAFALAAHAPPYPARCYRVSESYFAATGAATKRDAMGRAAPPGLQEATAQNKRPPREKKAKPKEEARPGAAEEVKDVATSEWGLTRVDDIFVAPGQTVKMFLCVGVGGDVATARESAQTLLGLAEDATPIGEAPREGLYTKAVALHQKTRFASGDDAIDRLMAQSLANIPFVLARRVGVPSRRDPEQGGAYQPSGGGLIALAWSSYRPDWAAAQLNAWFLSRSDPAAPVSRPQAAPPTNLFAFWELYQRTHDRAMLSRFYPFARRRYRELLAAGRAKETDWLFVWPEAARFHTFPGSDTPQTAGLRLSAPDYSAYVLRAARIMRYFAEQMRQPKEEADGYTRDAVEAARALNATLWDARRGLYLAKAADNAAAPLLPDTIGGLLPLIAGPDSLSAEQRAALRKALTDPATFWSEAGIRSVSKASPAYRPDARHSGAVSFSANWMLWKALLDLGETDLARQLADTVTRAYHTAQSASDSCPEWLNGDTGAARGAPDASGEACAVVALHAAYHRPGTVSTGWDVVFLDSRYEAEKDTLHLVYRPLSTTSKATLVCVLGKPNGQYALSGAFQGAVTADANGVLTFPVSPGAPPLVLDIVPAPPAEAKP